MPIERLKEFDNTLMNCLKCLILRGLLKLLFDHKTLNEIKVGGIKMYHKLDQHIGSRYFVKTGYFR